MIFFLLNLSGIVLLPFLLPVLLTGVILLTIKIMISILIYEIKGLIKCLKHLLLE